MRHPRFHRCLASLLALGLTVPVAVAAQVVPLPQHLRDTGLYIDGSTTVVRPGIMAFTPQYPLWSDGAVKRRWLYLPPGSHIDATQPNAWEFPRGTRLWKEFSVGRRVETRYMERQQDGSWRYATYLWTDDGSDALLAPADGIPAMALPQSPTGRYSIPSEMDCRACHDGAPSPVLGVSALQLSTDRDPLAPHAERPRRDDVDLGSLVARGWVRNLPQRLIDAAPRIEAASADERAALGYLHGNCGHCHADPRATAAAVPVGIVLAQDVMDPAAAATVMRALLGAQSRFVPSGGSAAAPVVAPGDSRNSVLSLRMRSRNPQVQMPPLGTAIPDSAGLALIERWIDHDLPATTEIRR
jgi:hypothetical protein